MKELVEYIAGLEDALRYITLAKTRLASYRERGVEKLLDEAETALRAKIKLYREKLEYAVRDRIAERVVDEIIKCYSERGSPYDCNELRMFIEHLKETRGEG